MCFILITQSAACIHTIHVHTQYLLVDQLPDFSLDLAVWHV